MTKSFSILLFFGSHIIQRQKEPTKAHQIKLDVVVKALKWLEIDMDVDEVP
jgi:nuclear mRNA export protein PCID2/THP1